MYYGPHKDKGKAQRTLNGLKAYNNLNCNVLFIPRITNLKTVFNNFPEPHHTVAVRDVSSISESDSFLLI